MKPQHYRAIWPITGDGEAMSVHQLIDEARPDLTNILQRSRLEPAGRARWCIRMGQDVPGSGGAASVLVADLPVTPIPRDVDPISGERDATRITRYEEAS